MKIFIVVIKENKVSGLVMPKIRKISFIKSPENIRNAILKPTERRIISDIFRSFIFNILMKINPGIVMKYTNPITCLITGISKKTVAHTMN